MTRLFGIDFTSRPTRSKPITCVEARLDNGVLSYVASEVWPDFSAFEGFLRSNGPWVAALDFPFGQSRRFIEAIGWPGSWEGYVNYVSGLSRKAFREELDEYRRPRAPGDKEHKRVTDALTGAVSSQKLYGVPVGLMFFEGAPRLLRSDVNIPLLRPTEDDRTALEAYPGVLARQLIGREPYKQDASALQSDAHAHARKRLLEELCAGNAGVGVSAPMSLVDDPKGDTLDALLCAVQAALAFRRPNYGIPEAADALEGWIVGQDL